MYCVNCGVRLADTETKCPLCDVPVGQKLERQTVAPLYPKDRIPYTKVNKGAVNGALLILWLIPLLVMFFVDLQGNGKLDWFYYGAGALVLSYIMFGLPGWFKKPNPVIFVPCSFAAVAAYLLLIALLTDGNWYLPFALPVTGCFAVVVTTPVVLLRYIKKGRLYILGGTLMALGAVMLLVEFLMMLTFRMPYVGWSVYPLIALFLLGGMLIFLGINKTARERMERRFFF